MQSTTHLPTQEQCLNYFEQYVVPLNIKRHCLAVQEVALFLANELLKSGVDVDAQLVSKGALLHDLFKMVGIKDPTENKFHQVVFTKEQLAKREELCLRFPGKYENEVAYEIFKDKFPQLATTLLNEGNPRSRDRNLVESIIHYADYRIFKDQVVLLSERFEYFKKKYEAPANFWDDYLHYTLKEEQKIFSNLPFLPSELKEKLANEIKDSETNNNQAEHTFAEELGEKIK